MSNIEAVNGLLTAIHLDRFAEIEALHAPNVYFTSFRGPTLQSSVSVADWHREFLRDYQDCNYTELEYIEEGNIVATRATIEAKGYDWRVFTQRVVEVLRITEAGVEERRLYGMLRDLELEKVPAGIMTAATEFRGGSASATRTLVKTFYDALLAGDTETATAQLAEKSLLIDTVYGVATGAESILALVNEMPRPAFGMWRVTNTYAGVKDALVELAIDPNRPRAADWVRIVDGKIAVIERYWMLREIGVDPFIQRANERHARQIILPT